MKIILILLAALLLFPLSENSAEISFAQAAGDMDWLKKYIHPLTTYDPGFEDYRDLDFLGQAIGNKKVIALGEVSHGSHEIYMMKHRIIRYLSKYHGFDILSAEAPLPEADKVNAYIFTGKGNPAELIRGMHYWVSRTQEILDMVEWMRSRNLEGHPVKYSGFDMQYYSGAIEALKQGFIYDVETTRLIGTLSLKLDSFQRNSGMPVIGKITGAGKQVVDPLIRKIGAKIEAGKFTSNEKEWLSRNLRIVEQSVANTPWDREIYMAENFEWICNRHPGSRFVVWGHNMHIMRTNHHPTLLPMGGYLSKTFGDEYLNVGFAFYEGSYTALKGGRLGVHAAEQAYEGTYEYMFRQFNIPLFLLDLREIKADNSLHARVFKNQLKFRHTGAIKTGVEFGPKNITDDYDFILFIHKSSPSTLLD